MYRQSWVLGNETLEVALCGERIQYLNGLEGFAATHGAFEAPIDYGLGCSRHGFTTGEADAFRAEVGLRQLNPRVL